MTMGGALGTVVFDPLAGGWQRSEAGTDAGVALVELGYEVPINVTGQIVVEIGEGTPADGVFELGDVIVSVDGTEIREVTDLNDLLEPTRPGDEVVLGVERDGVDGVIDLPLVLGARPDDLEYGFIGVSLSPRDLVYDFPFEVEIDTDDGVRLSQNDPKLLLDALDGVESGSKETLHERRSQAEEFKARS